MKEVIDKHLDSAMFFLAIIGMLFTFYSTNSATYSRIDATNSRIDATNELIMTMQKENAEYHADVRELQKAYYQFLMQQHEKKQC